MVADVVAVDLDRERDGLAGRVGGERVDARLEQAGEVLDLLVVDGAEAALSWRGSAP